MDSQATDIRDKLRPFRRRWFIVVFIAVAVSALTYYHYRGQPPKYVASATVFVRSPGQAPVVGVDQETDPNRRLQNAVTLLQTPSVAATVAHHLNYQGDPDVLLSQIAVAPSADSDFMIVTATSTDPPHAAALANGFADAFVSLTGQQTRAIMASEVTTIESELAQLKPTNANQTVRINLEQQLQDLRVSGATAGGYQVVAPASVPTINGAPSPTRNALFAAVLGLVLGCLVVVGLEAFNRRLRHPMVETEYGLPLLASIPFSRRAHGATRSGSRLPAPLMERVRGLRTMLEHGGQGGVPRTVLITSAIPGEGKSTLVKSLALAYYEGAKSVLVIDADLRRPMMHEFFEAPLVPGLSDVLRSSTSLSAAAQEVQPADIEPAYDPVLTASESALALEPARSPRLAEATPTTASEDGNTFRTPVLHLLTAGSGTSDPAALLGSAQLKTLLAEATVRYDVVLMDSPPVLSVSDAIPLATDVDAVIVVARAEFTTRDAAMRCRRALERVQAVKLLGVVANAVRSDDDYAPRSS